MRNRSVTATLLVQVMRVIDEVVDAPLRVMRWFYRTAVARYANSVLPLLRYEHYTGPHRSGPSDVWYRRWFADLRGIGWYWMMSFGDSIHIMDDSQYGTS